MTDILSIETPYQDQDTVTSTNLNDLVKKATFTSAVVDGATTQLSSGAIIVRDGGITEQKLDTATQAKLLQGPEIEAPLSNTDAFVGGTKAGDARGTFALDIQNKRPVALSSAVASGDSSVALGFENKASSDNCIAVGNGNTASGDGSSAFGNYNISQNQYSVALGRNCFARMDSSVVVGKQCLATGSDSNTTEGISIGVLCQVSSHHGMTIGNNVAIGSSSSKGTTEIGQWSVNGVLPISGYHVERFKNNSGHSIRMHPDRQIALSLASSSTAPVDGGVTDGNEISGSLPREMFTIQRDGDAFSLYFNDAGTIKSLSLGSVS